MRGAVKVYSGRDGVVLSQAQHAGQHEDEMRTNMRTPRRQRILFCLGAFLILLGFIARVGLARRPSGATAAHVADSRSAVAHGQQLIAAYGKLPLSFESNQGQMDQSVQFIAHGARQAILLTSAEAILNLPGVDESGQSSNSDVPASLGSWGALIPSMSGSEIPRPGAEARSADPRILRMTLVGARRDVQGVGMEKLSGTANYFLGNDPKNWKTNIDTYSRVIYENVYPGVDLIYYGNQEELEDDFVLNPGSDPKSIKLLFQGAQRVHLDESTGDLLLSTSRQREDIRLRKPVIYQQGQATSATEKDGTKQFVDGRYVIDPQGRVGFEIGQYDRSRLLVIDPVLSYFTYLGGMLPDVALRIAVDSGGNAYVTGATVSPDFQVTTGALRNTLFVSICGNGFGAFGGSGATHFPCPDAFVTKLNPTGTAAVYSTYLGGTRSDIGFGIAVDSSGNAYVTGQTESPDFPTTASGFQRNSALGLAKAFLVKLDPTGSQILYSSYLGGTAGSWGVGGNDHQNDTWATAVAADNSGDAWVVGYTRSNSFPTTLGVIQPNPADISTIQTSGSIPKGLCPIVSLTFVPTSSFLVSYRCSDGFVSKLNTDLSGASSLVYSTYLGGNNFDAATGIAVDSSGNAYVAGTTLSSNFPTANAFQGAFGGGQCGPPWKHICASTFVTKLNSTATALIFSTYLGVNADNAATGIAVDSAGNAYVTGFTNSTNFPTSAGVTQPSHATGLCGFGTFSMECPDAFVAKFSSTGSRLYSTYLGGSSADVGLSVAADSQGNAYVTGTTNSTNFPTSNPSQANPGGGTCTLRGPASAPFSFTCPDVFVSKLDSAGATLLFSSYLGGNNADIGTGIAVDASNNIYLTGATLSTGLATAGVLQSSPGGMGDAFVAKLGSVSVSDFSIGAASGGSLSATVTAGNPAVYNLQVNPSSGFTGSVSLACTGAPAYAGCNPSTTPVTVSGTSSVPFIVNVTTTKGSFVAPGRIRELFPRIPKSPVTMNFFLFLVALAICRMALKGRTTSLRAYVHAAIILVALTTLLTACGSGGYAGGTGGGTPGTPAGTYTLTITGTSGGLSHTANLTLTVN